MLEDIFAEIYTKFKMHFYRQVFKGVGSSETNLTTVEIFCMECITSLNDPTVAEFSRFMNISTPNAAYKVNNLVQKGYVEKIQSAQDKREFHLRPTKKYLEYSDVSDSYIKAVMNRAKDRFSEEEIRKIEDLLRIVSEELMQDPLSFPLT